MKIQLVVLYEVVANIHTYRQRDRQSENVHIGGGKNVGRSIPMLAVDLER